MKSLTIIQETRPGLLAEITTLLEREGVNMQTIDGDTIGSSAVISIMAEPYDKCFNALAEAGFKVFSHDQILIRIDDEPGALAEISRKLANEQIDIRSVHLVDRKNGQAIVAIETENDYRCRQILRELIV